MNGNKFASGQILKKLVEVVKGQILADWAQKSPEPCFRADNCIFIPQKLMDDFPAIHPFAVVNLHFSSDKRAWLRFWN